MPLNLWGMDRRDVWRTCFCFHVRTATVFIGVLHLMSYVLTLSYVAANFMYEPNQDGLMVTNRPDHLPLPTPQSSRISPNNGNFEEPKLQAYSQDVATKRGDNFRNSPFTFGMDHRKLNSQAILLEVCNMLITLLMVYGAVRGKPSYLMPFFVLKVFDFCIFCLKMVGIFSYLPNVTELIASQPALPFRDELLRMDPQHLSLLALIVIVSTIAIKAYIIGVIWNCYKYLMLRNTVIRGVIAYRQDDPSHMLGIQQNLLPDLPDYETAVNDPRYAKKPPLDPSATSFNVPTTGTATHGVTSENSTMVFTSAQPSTMSLPPPPPYSSLSYQNPTTQIAASPQPVNVATTAPVAEVETATQVPSPVKEEALEQNPSTAPLGSETTVVNNPEITDTVVVVVQTSSPSATTNPPVASSQTNTTEGK